MVTQNLYLRTTHEGWGELFFGAVVEALDKVSGQDSAEVWPMLLLVAGFIAEDRTGGAITNSVDAVFAAMAGALVLIVSSGAVILMLRQIALHGRAQLAWHRSEMLPDIKVWPIEWPSVTDFLIAIFLASVAFFISLGRNIIPRRPDAGALPVVESQPRQATVGDDKPSNGGTIDQ